MGVATFQSFKDEAVQYINIVNVYQLSGQLKLEHCKRTLMIVTTYGVCVFGGYGVCVFGGYGVCVFGGRVCRPGTSVTTSNFYEASEIS